MPEMALQVDHISAMSEQVNPDTKCFVDEAALQSNTISEPTSPVCLSNQDSSSIPISPLLTLPAEMHSLIWTSLSWHDLKVLRFTNRLLAFDILSTSSLSAIHRARQQHAYEDERYHRRTTLGYNNPHWSGFIQGWATHFGNSLSETLPCYRCLRWLPAADHSLESSAFTRGMACGQRDLGREKARSRVCVECGLRCGLYEKGNKVRHQIICRSCGTLGEHIRRPDPQNTRTELDSGLLKNRQLRYHFFRKTCVESPGGEVPVTRIEFEHERRWAKYERGLAEGKKYRAEKGRRIRLERGIEDQCPQEMSSDGQKQSERDVGHPTKHWCPVMKQDRMCSCWKTGGKELSSWAFGADCDPWIW